jgi:integrase
VWAELKAALPVSSFKRLTEGVLPDDPLKLTEFEQRFYDHTERREKLGQIGAQARQNYDRATKLFFDRALEAGLARITDLTPEFVESHLLWRKETIQAKGGSGRGIVTDVVVLSALFDLAVEEKWLAKSPLKYKPQIPAVEKLVQPFTPEEVARMEELDKPSEEGLVFAVLRGSGLRCSDVATLRWTAVDWGGKTLRVLTAKRGKRIEVPMSKELVRKMDDAHIPGDTGPVFPELTSAKIYRMVRDWGKRAGVENCHPHRFRHHFATNLLSKGASLFDVAKLLGDTTSVIEKHYAKWTPGQAERVRDLMESVV